MSNKRSFRLAMAALAVTIVAAIALISSPAPALAGCGAPPPDPSTCAEVSPFCAANGICFYGSVAACEANFSYLCAASATGTCTDDGRVNDNCSAPEIVYCDEDEVDFYYYNYVTGEGEYD